jgi:regulatory protein
VASPKKLDGNEAFKKIYQLVAVKERSVQEIKTRLAQKNFSEEVIESALMRALSCGLVDDARFAEVLVRSRMNAGKGKSGIARELESHNIDSLLIERLLNDSSFDGHPSEEESEIERALSFLERKPPTAKNKREAAYRKLLQKGYSASVSSSAARQWFESQS